MSTKVVFRKFSDNDVIALFPDIEADRKGNIESYMSNGQHAAASRSLIDNAALAMPEEYTELFTELQRQGYSDLHVLAMN